MYFHILNTLITCVFSLCSSDLSINEKLIQYLLAVNGSQVKATPLVYLGFGPNSKTHYEELIRWDIMQTKSFQVYRNLNLAAYYRLAEVVEAHCSFCSQVHEQIERLRLSNVNTASEFGFLTHRSHTNTLQHSSEHVWNTLGIDSTI